jgi:23S rRNA (adenine2503-C2)-methyltransferase
MPQKINLKNLSKKDIYGFIKNLGLPRYRADQLIHWIYKKNVSAIDEITEFSKSLRLSLGKRAFIERLISADGTEKFLFSLEDGNTVESVLIPEENRLTLCLSSQVGCALGCRFCQTGRQDYIRNLKAYEIIDQILAARKELPSSRRITNIVFMGMGEPLANFNEVIEALWRIVLFIGISKRKITVSTAGIVPKILRLSQKAPEINLAVSLNATTDVSREKVMPINRKYPLKALINACRKFPLQPRRRITFEYILIEGVNDSSRDAERLISLLKNLRCKINLIPLNQSDEGSLKAPREGKILDFQKILIQNNMTAIIRNSKGKDICAACGQLKSRYLSKYPQEKRQKN